MPKRLLMPIGLLKKSPYMKVMLGFYILSMITSFFNYLYYPFMARLTEPDTYGEIQFLVTIIMQVTVVFMALNVITIILSVRYRTQAALLHRKVASLASTFNILTAILTIGAVAVLILNQEAFKFTSYWPFVVLGLSIVSTVPFTITIGKLQGQNRFLSAGLLGAGGSALKLLCSVMLVMAGAGTTGAILGIGLGQGVAVLIAIILGKVNYTEVVNLNVRLAHHLRDDVRLIIFAGLGVFLGNILIAVDTIGAKLILPPEEAGLYAGIATLAKIAVFIISPLLWLVIPAAAEIHRKRTTVRLIVFCSFALCLCLLWLYAAVPELTIRTLVGSDFTEASNLLLPATLAMSALSIATLLLTILAAGGHLRMFLLLTLGMTLVTGLVAFNEEQLEGILSGQLYGGIFGILTYSLFILFRIMTESTHEQNSD